MTGICPAPGCRVDVSYSHPSPAAPLPALTRSLFALDVMSQARAHTHAGVSNPPPSKFRALSIVGLIDAAGCDDSFLATRSCFPQPWLLSLHDCRSPCLADTLSLVLRLPWSPPGPHTPQKGNRVLPIHSQSGPCRPPPLNSPPPAPGLGTHREMTSAGRFLGTALESTQKAVSLVQEQLGGQGGVLGGLLELTCSIRQNPSTDSASSLSREPRLMRSPAMLPASSASRHRLLCPAALCRPAGWHHLATGRPCCSEGPGCRCGERTPPALLAPESQLGLMRGERI